MVEGEGECLTPWDVQSRRIYEEHGKWPAIYSGEGGGHGYVISLQGNMIDREVQQNGSGIAESETMFTLNATDRHGVAIPINTQIATRHISLGERTGMGWGADGDPAYTLQAGHEHAVLCAVFTAGQGAKANGIGYAEEQAPTLRTDGGLSAMPTVLCRGTANTNAETYEDLSPTITACHDGPPVVFESHSQVEERYAPDVSKALRAKANCSFREDAETFVAEKHLRWIVRRLTPKECERLQGYPDGWTDIGEWTDSKGKRHKPADSPRYKALGNSIALPQWWWLTCKMAEYLPAHATLGSLFDGIGGFPLVWETYHGKGTALWASEIEEFPIAVTRRRFSDA